MNSLTPRASVTSTEASFGEEILRGPRHSGAYNFGSAPIR
jgi:hypothetical protein